MEAQRRRVHGRRRRLRPAQRATLARALPALRLALPEAPDEALDPARLLPRPVDDLWLEIGFGAGEHLAFQARTNPGVGLIGCEPFIQGVSRLLREIETDGTGERVRIFPDDALLLMRRLPDASIGRLFMLFPDPWPKKRHHKRRLIDPGTLAECARVLKDDAEFRIASDVPDYVRWTLRHVLANDAFAWTAETAQDWRTRPADWPETRYERKARDAGRTPIFLRYRRKPRR